MKRFTDERRFGAVVGRFGLRTAMLWLALQTTLFACPVCFQIEDGRAAAGVRAAVIVLMAVTAGVLTGFGLFIRRFIQRP